ncbi:MAG: lamin tail domain-containing protein, partial [Candidatus Nealsonbacteria bacterium]|nr:lamin tail domain-containing protein [Candidatus Nealsonbacteria bacterium]
MNNGTRATGRARRMLFETLEPRQVLQGGPLVSEFMAVNNHTLADEDGDFSDWIEIHNPAATPIDLDGWYLTDKADNLTKWQFP